MIKLSINLPLGKRLDITLVKRRGGLPDPILPDTKIIKNIKKGSKISRYFRLIFENQRIKKILGTNLPIILIASSILPQTDIKNPSIVDSQTLAVYASETTTTEKAIRYPVEKIAITQGYRFFHPGIDFDGETGDPIYPFAKGKVKEIQFSKTGYGNAILVDHGNGITSLYAHLSKIFVKEGEEVRTNQKMAHMGSTGRATGDHLHFEIRKDGIPFDPFVILPLPRSTD